MSRLNLTLALAAVLALSACTEKVQTASGRKSDEKPWVSANTAFDAAGYKPAGDRAAWEQQIKARNQSQNEYNRTGSH
ncbi:MAG: hypothetical protein DI603_11570 [Roseateles depolymerans]|uniref:Lipoprotein n=1 Tax=Roseateles depolymerans TaxID=76731 RepID=A0A2W5DSF3_9BURK|nr:MAG: hypothetical protein DI603_11570 [Roseateles depolymerans]